MNISPALSKRVRVWTRIFVLIAALAASLPSLSQAAAPPDVVRSWNELALQRVRETGGSDAQAARLYAMVNLAMYDAVNGIIARTGNKGRVHAIVAPTHNAKGDEYAAAAAAAHAILSVVPAGTVPLPTSPAQQAAQQAAYDAQLASDLAAAGKGGKINDGQQWGAYVGAQVLAARASDGSTPNEAQMPDPNPVGHFRTTWQGTQFRNLAPFGVADSSVYFGQGLPPLPSLDYAGAWAEVKIIGNNANPDPGKVDTFKFWSLGGGTSQPPGAWIQVSLAVTATYALDLPEETRLFGLVSMAMADTVAPTVMTKWLHKHWRPFHAIREADTDGNPLTEPRDDAWSPRATGNPPIPAGAVNPPSSIGSSPEYWSGHSSFSAAAAAVLAGFFAGDNVPFTLKTDSAPNGQPRMYTSFSAAAEEAGLSRVVGGIHFRFSNEEGLKAGRAVAKEILLNKLLRKQGPTHFGESPL